MVWLFELSILSLLLPLASSFQVIAPKGSVTIGKTAQVQWIRHNGDPASFSLLLRRDSQDRGGKLIKTIQSTGDSQGTEQFTVAEKTDYLIEIISDLQPLQENQAPARILASSDKFTAVQDSNPPEQNTSQTTTPATTTSSKTTAQTTTQTTPPPTGTTTDSGGNSNKNNGGNDQSEPTKTGGSGITAGTVTSPFVGSSASGESSGGTVGTASQAQGPQDKGTGPLARLTTVSTPTGGTLTGTGTGTSTTPFSSPTGEPLPSGASKKLNPGVIVGSVLGALVLLLLVFFLLFQYNRRKRRRQTLEYAFRRDLMVRNMEPGDRSFSFHSVSPSEFNTPGPSNQAHLPKMSEVSTAGFTTYQKYWETQPVPDNSKDVKETATSLAHGPSASGTSTFTSSTSPSVFYTAVPKPAQGQPPALAPGFTFPVRPPSAPAETPTPTTTSTSTKTDRQIAIQNKMNQLRTQLTILQSRNARGSGFTDDSKSATEEGGSQREEIGKIREELERLGEIMNSGWAMRRTESGGDVPAGLKV